MRELGEDQGIALGDGVPYHGHDVPDAGLGVACGAEVASSAGAGCSEGEAGGFDSGVTEARRFSGGGRST